ncbi:MAG: hypothetical protein KDA24_00175 [Deltaproteobacteria bacterium]|nr:hypothetical protein [Deltaproteobacteria bacterium]
MRSMLLLLALTLAASGCRTTHDADAGELEQLGEVDFTLQTGNAPSTDFGQFSLGAISAVQPSLRYLSNKDRADGSNSAAIVHQEELELLRQVTFAGSGARDEWPECLTELDDGVIYDDCVLGVEVPSVSIGFSADGEYKWSENSSSSELALDFGANVVGFGIGTTLDWTHQLDWTDTTLEGSFDMAWLAGVTLGGSPSATSVQFRLDGTIEGLVTDDGCEGPIGGVLDWRAQYREGFDPVETTRVTVEWLSCDEATVTW